MNFFNFLSSAAFFSSKYLLLYNSFKNNKRMSNSVDPAQARQNVGPELGPNCLQRFSADSAGRQQVGDQLHKYVKK